MLLSRVAAQQMVPCSLLQIIFNFNIIMPEVFVKGKIISSKKYPNRIVASSKKVRARGEKGEFYSV